MGLVVPITTTLPFKTSFISAARITGSQRVCVLEETVVPCPELGRVCKLKLTREYWNLSPIKRVNSPCRRAAQPAPFSEQGWCFAPYRSPQSVYAGYKDNQFGVCRHALMI